jgi:Ice-binding-like/Secretion system C-terminal sorting domain
MMMKKILISSFLMLSLTASNFSFGQAPPLGSTANFVLFTKVGAIDNIGLTSITGDIGTDAGAINNLTGMVNGMVHTADPTTNQAANDVTDAYNSLGTTICGVAIAIGLGGGQVFTPNVYCSAAASTLTGDLILDAQNDPNAVFVIKIEGAFTAASLSNIVLANSARACNVYWQIQGAFSLGANANFKGTIVGSGAINFAGSSTLEGRGLTTAGAISTNVSTITKSVCSSLPINLLSFDAKKQQNATLINWVTASEQNNARFDLQKSFDARSFKTIATIKGMGTINEAQSYTFLDENKEHGNNAINTLYYRLKQIDFNESFNYSKIIAIKDDIKKPFFLYPNPALEQVFIQNITEGQDFKINDLLGKTVMSGKINDANALNISALQAGFYFITIQSTNIKFLKH